MIHRIPALTQGSLEEQRARLLRLIESARPQGSFKNRVTVVFDGQVGIWGGERGTSVEVVFSKAESADELLKKMVAGADNKKNIVVVTDDREIQYAVRAHGAAVRTPADFFARARPARAQGAKKSGRPGGSSQPAKHIPATLEYEITSELEKIWVKKGK